MGGTHRSIYFRYISHCKPLPSQPSHLRFRDLNALLIRKRNRQRKSFPWSHRQITRKSPDGTGRFTVSWPSTDQRGRSHRGTSGEATVGRIEKGMGASQGEGLNRKAGLGNTPRLPLLGNAWGESIASISGASRCSVLPTLNLRQVLLA